MSDTKILSAEGSPWSPERIAEVLEYAAAEAQGKAMLEALSPKMAGDIADILLEYCESNRQLARRHYAYAAVAKGKG